MTELSEDKGRTGRRLWRVSVYVVFLLGILAGLEGAARLLGGHARDPGLRRVLRDSHLLARGYTSHFRFVPDSELPYRLRPGFERRARDGLKVTRHNGCGFRGDSDFRLRSPDALRIVCLGASTTYGVGVVDNGDTYPALLEESLNGEFRPDGWSRVEVLNLGVGGYTSSEVLATLRLHGLPLAPDVVLVQSAINDVAPRFYPDFRDDYSHFRKRLAGVTPGPMARRAHGSWLLVMLGWQFGIVEPLTLQARTQHPIPPADEALANLSVNGPECFARNLREAVNSAQSASAQVWLLTQAYLDMPEAFGDDDAARRLEEGYRQGLKEHNGVVRQTAREAGAGLVDIDRLMPRRQNLFTDPIHMSEEGNWLKARLVARRIRNELPRPQHPAPTKERAPDYSGSVD